MKRSRRILLFVVCDLQTYTMNICVRVCVFSAFVESLKCDEFHCMEKNGLKFYYNVFYITTKLRREKATNA